MDELIDIVNLQGKPTGNNCLKSFAHKNGILHASVHIWLYTKEQQILVQKRKSDKEIFPNLWDVSVAGHIASNETPITAAIREIKEEINLTITEKELTYIHLLEEKHKHSNKIIDHEIHHIYIAELTCSIDKLIPQKEEVSAIKLISTKELETNCNNSKIYVPHGADYYHYIINTLKETKI